MSNKQKPRYRITENEYGDVEILEAPDGREVAFMGEPEDRSFFRDANGAVVELNRLHDDYTQLLDTFRHVHVSNGEDDACASCGLDLRNPIHKEASL